MKNLFLKFVLPLFIISFFTLKAEAIIVDENHSTLQMVTGDNSYTVSGSLNNYQYTPDQTPWAYLKLKFDELNLNNPLQISWTWFNSNNPALSETKIEDISIVGLDSDKEIWSAAPEPWWNTHGGSGQWSVYASWGNHNGTTSTNFANFNVTPEPISSALFLLGGAPIIAALRKKRKTV